MPGSEGGGASPGTVADAVVVAEAPRRWATNAAPDARGGPEVTLLVRLLDEGERATPAPGLDPARFIDWCRRNKFPLLSLERHTPAWLAEDPDFARALAAESDWFATQHGEYHRLRDAWLARGIPCLLIKSAGEHPAFPHSSDNIDILVHPEQGLAARETLRDLGYVELRNIEEPGKFLFRRFSDGVCVSAIHLHERIAWFVGFLDDQAVWRRARAAHDDPAVTIPASEDAVLINLAHA
ncbi:MAG TPA: nucleotidyltransferase family protein, partial [Nitrolancea sp.]|nr:nucleotidyltransferase family protein [Nitrolancea sp.]